MIKVAQPGIQNIAAQYVYLHYKRDNFLTRLLQTRTSVSTAVCNVVFRFKSNAISSRSQELR